MCNTVSKFVLFFSFLFVWAVWALALPVPALQAQGQVLTVGSRCTYADLQTAVKAAGSGDTIRVAAATFSASALHISGKTLAIEGGYEPGCVTLGHNPTILDGLGNGNQSVINLDQGAGQRIVLRNIHVRNGNAPQGGGLRIVGGYDVTLDQVTLSGNSASDGGGVYLSNGRLRVTNGSQINDNSAAALGGGIHAADQGVVIVDGGAQISGNSAFHGGGIALRSGGQLEARTFILSRNAAAQNGGAIYNEDGAVRLTGSNPASKVGRNTAVRGAGIYDMSGGILYLEANGRGETLTINNNTAVADGGGLYLTNATSPAVSGGVEISYNSAGSYGAGLLQQGGDGRFRSSAGGRPRIAGNLNQFKSGAGMHLTAVDDSSAVLDGPYLSNVDVTANQALQGNGGGIFAGQSNLRFDSVRFTGNSARFSGGGLFTVASTVQMVTSPDSGCRQATLPPGSPCAAFDGNTTAEALADGLQGSGGAVWADDTSTLAIVGVVFTGNSSPVEGSVIASSGTVSLTNALILANPGPIAIVSMGAMQLDSVTLADNPGAALFNTTLGDLTLKNSIIWNNGQGVVGKLQIAGNGCSIVQNSVGGSSQDPQFVAAAQGDYHLSPDSPAVDACPVGPDADLDGTARPQGSAYDMGAFEVGE